MRKMLLSIFAMFFCAASYAQEMPKIIPGSPTAYELTKSGVVPVGMFTGVPNVNVPLYVYTTNNFSIPISLSYSSSGIKVDQLTSNVGLGWSLNAGGVISRIVRGKEDENYPVEHPVNEINSVDLAGISGGLTQSYASPNSVKPEIVKYIYDAAEYGMQDTQTDLFSYSFMGHSGKIVRGDDSKIFTVPHSNLDIIFAVDNSKIAITTEDGIEYLFEDTEINNSTTKSNLIPGHNPPEQAYTTSWFLTKMTHPKGEVVNFTYEAHNYINETKAQSLRLGINYPFNPANPGIETNTTYSRIDGVALTKISSTHHGEVAFENSIIHPTITGYKLTNKVIVKDNNNAVIEEFDFDYVTTNNNRIFLDKVKFNNPDKEYSFSYDLPSNLPARFSYSQDFWGYYNGYSNQSLLPDLATNLLFTQATNQLANKEPRHSYSKTGLLTKITYPTKGYTNFIYEANAYNDLAAQVVNASYSATLIAEDTKTTTFTIPALSSGERLSSFKLYAEVEQYLNGTNCGDYPEDKATIKVQIYDVTNSTYIYDNMFVDGIYPDQTIPDLVDNRQYQLIITNKTFGSGGDDACVDAIANIKFTTETTSLQNIETGGSRIKATENYTEYNVKSDYKRYYYGKMNSLNVSSGDETNRYAGHVSMDIDRVLTGSNGAWVIVENTYNTLSSSGSFPLFNSGSNNIYYKHVTVSHGDDNFLGGGQEYEYHITRDSPAEILIGSDPNMVIPNFSNTGWDHGLTKQVQTFKKEVSTSNLIVVNKTENLYTNDTLVADVSNYYIQKYFPFVGFNVPDPTYVCKSEDLTKRTPIWQCQNTNSSHDHFISDTNPFLGIFHGAGMYYGGGKGPLTLGNDKCRASNNNNTLVRYINHACYGQIENFVASYPEKISNLNILKYKTLSYWHYLSKTITTNYDYDGNNPVVNTSEYFYDNDYHLKQTRSEVTNSKGEVLKAKYYYANEMNDTTLLDAHRIGEVIKTESFNGSTLLSTQNTVYSTFNTNYLPEKIQISIGSNTLEDKIVFHSYYDNGNVKEVSKKDGTKIYYVWGYNNTQPIAMIEGYTTVFTSTQLTLISEAISASNSDTTVALENTLRTELQDLRNGFSDAQVSSYTYDPLIGVTSITDPRGKTVYYHYDSYARLEYVKDFNGNILTKNEYNYKN